MSRWLNHVNIIFLQSSKKYEKPFEAVQCSSIGIIHYCASVLEFQLLDWVSSSLHNGLDASKKMFLGSIGRLETRRLSN
jgi:hypothetical protein